MINPKRRWARFSAWFRRKFFTNCPRCGHAFGGHEAHTLQVSFQDAGAPKHYRYVCGACAKEGRAA